MEYRIYQNSTLPADLDKRAAYEEHLKMFRELESFLKGKTIEEVELDIRAEILDSVKDSPFFQHLDVDGKEKFFKSALNNYYNFIVYRDLISSHPHYSVKPFLLETPTDRTEHYKKVKAFVEAYISLYKNNEADARKMVEAIASRCRVSSGSSESDKILGFTVNNFLQFYNF